MLLQAMLSHSPAYAVPSDEQFAALERRFNQLQAEMGVLAQASYELPIGSIIAWGGDSVQPLPRGYLRCDGRWVRRGRYSALIQVLGESFTGERGTHGDDEFQLPDFRGRTLVGAANVSPVGITARNVGDTFGAETHLLSVSELPAHAHGITDNQHTHAATDTGHSHGISDPGHSHGEGANMRFGSGAANWASTTWTTPQPFGLHGHSVDCSGKQTSHNRKISRKMSHLFLSSLIS